MSKLSNYDKHAEPCYNIGTFPIPYTLQFLPLNLIPIVMVTDMHVQSVTFQNVPASSTTVQVKICVAKEALVWRYHT